MVSYGATRGVTCGARQAGTLGVTCEARHEAASWATYEAFVVTVPWRVGCVGGSGGSHYYGVQRYNQGLPHTWTRSHPHIYYAALAYMTCKGEQKKNHETITQCGAHAKRLRIG